MLFFEHLPKKKTFNIIRAAGARRQSPGVD
jgi:hypothetical protein